MEGGGVKNPEKLLTLFMDGSKVKYVLYKICNEKLHYLTFVDTPSG